MRRVFFGATLISLMMCSIAFAGNAPNADSNGSQEMQKPSSPAQIRRPKNNEQVSRMQSELRSGPRSLHRLMRQNIPPLCRFHLLPKRRRLRPIRGLAFTSELALALALLSHKDCTSLCGVPRLQARSRSSDILAAVQPLPVYPVRPRRQVRLVPTAEVTQQAFNGFDCHRPMTQKAPDGAGALSFERPFEDQHFATTGACEGQPKL